MEATIIIIIIIALYIIPRFFDADRITIYLSERNCTLIEKKWQPFGPGWFGEKDSRIYEITYRDAQGDIHHAYAKTSALSGVYLTEDQITKKKPHDASVEKKCVSPREDQAPASTTVTEEKAALKQRLVKLEDEWTKTSERLADLDVQIAAATKDLADLESDK